MVMVRPAWSRPRLKHLAQPVSRGWARTIFSSPELKVKGAAVTAGQLGSNWVIAGAEAVSSGYDVAWKNTTTGLYNIWSTDTNGNHITDLVAVSLH